MPKCRYTRALLCLQHLAETISCGTRLEKVVVIGTSRFFQHNVLSIWLRSEFVLFFLCSNKIALISETVKIIANCNLL